MDKAARIELDVHGMVVAVDDAFCAMVGYTADQLIGMSMVDLAPPADQAKCIWLFSQLKEHGTPISTVNRLIRRNMSNLWVFSRADEIASHDGIRRFGVSICESAPPLPRRDPGKLLEGARYMIAARRQRKKIFSSPIFGDHAWDMVCLAYAAEAEGSLLTMADLAAETGLTLASLARWIKGLCAEGLLEREGDDTAQPAGSIRLSAMGHRKFEHHLGLLVDRTLDEDELVD